MNLYDTHFHLDNDDDAGAIIHRAFAAGVNKMNLISCDLADTQRNILLAETYGICTTTGVHPLHIDAFAGDFSAFLPYCQHPKVVGIGEIGLDYYYSQDPVILERQKVIFYQFLQMSAQFNKPAIIHCREAFEDCYQAIKTQLKPQQPFIIHCYTGDVQWAQKFVELGGYISFSGIITFKNAQSIRDSIRQIPPERLLIETDSPYLAPVPFRGKRNEPGHVVHVLERLAFELGLTREAAAELTMNNSCRVFQV